MQHLRLTWLLRVCVTHPRFSLQNHHHHHFLRPSTTTSTTSSPQHHHFYSLSLHQQHLSFLPPLPNHYYHHHHFIILSSSSPQLFPIIPLLYLPIHHSYTSFQTPTLMSASFSPLSQDSRRVHKCRTSFGGLGGKNN